jgi:hypothetical protein
MRWLLVATVACYAALAASTAFASASEPPDPCLLVTTSDASKVLGATPPKAKTKTVALTRSCTYVSKKKAITVVTTRVATQAAFDQAAKKTGLAIPIQGVGADAWSVAGGKGLLVWKSGVQISFTFVGVSPFVGTQQSLAKTAVGRL